MIRISRNTAAPKWKFGSIKHGRYHARLAWVGPVFVLFSTGGRRV